MTEDRLTKKSVVKAEQIGPINVLDDGWIRNIKKA